LNNGKNLVVIAGPTAVGKTELCVRVARAFSCHVVSSDSRQFFKEMTIGTAKPDSKELENVPHHFIDCISVTDEMSAGRYEREALSVLEDLFLDQHMAILTGGSGLYIRAVTEGMSEMPDIGPHYREQLMEELNLKGLAPLQEELGRNDPDYFHQIDQNNTQRIVRALEVIRATGKPFSFFRNKEKQAPKRPFNIIKIGLERGRTELYERINKRVDQMLDKGLFDEAKALYPLKHLNALQTVGYKEIFDYLDGHIDWEEAVRLLKRNTRRYAKRQITWFKRDPQITWFHPQHTAEIISFINQSIKYA